MESARQPCRAAPQDLPKQLDDAGKREVLNQRMGGLPHNAAEIARRTRDEDLYFSPITDRRAPAGSARGAANRPHGPGLYYKPC